jgi:hypothetical protein
MSIDGLSINGSPTHMLLATNGGGVWKQSLYILQEKAPHPLQVMCLKGGMKSRPPFYGSEFHGMIERSEAEKVGTAF